VGPRNIEGHLVTLIRMNAATSRRNLIAPCSSRFPKALAPRGLRTAKRCAGGPGHSYPVFETRPPPPENSEHIHLPCQACSRQRIAPHPRDSALGAPPFVTFVTSATVPLLSSGRRPTNRVAPRPMSRQNPSVWNPPILPQTPSGSPPSLPDCSSPASRWSAPALVNHRAAWRILTSVEACEPSPLKRATPSVSRSN
jgi:hypothetical protein